jgi:hypothetical protein
MIRFYFLHNDKIYLPGSEPLPPKVEGPDLSDVEKTVLLIITAILMTLAVALTLYFYRKIREQATKDKERLINNMKSESEVVINGKQNIHS